jgi:hypothetical protein
VAFDGGAITSNAGAVLLGATDKTTPLCGRLATCFTNFRHASSFVHATVDLLRPHLVGLALGYEDLINHDALRFDPVPTAVLDKPGGVLAGRSTLNRLEHAGKIGLDRHQEARSRQERHRAAARRRAYGDLFRAASAHRARSRLDRRSAPRRAGGRHFHGDYDCYCYLLRYSFCSRHLLAAKLRTSSVDAAGASRRAASIDQALAGDGPRYRSDSRCGP